MKSIIATIALGVVIAVSGCAQDDSANAPRTSHYAARSNRLGSNIPQPYDASADRNDANSSALEQMQQQSNTTSGMLGSSGSR